MSGGEPSSIKQKTIVCRRAADLELKVRRTAGRSLSNCPRAVLWGAERECMGLQSPLYTKSRFQQKPAFDTRTTPPKAAESGIKSQAHVLTF